MADGFSFPALDDTDGWLAMVEASNAGNRQMLETSLPAAGALTRTDKTHNGVPCFELAPAGVTLGDGVSVALDLHPGGLISGGGDVAWMSSAAIAVLRQGVTWVPDYRTPPLHPYPAAVDDCLAVYAALVEQVPASSVVVSGWSAGGNLAAALLLRAKDAGLPMPAGVVLRSPELDLTESGDTFTTNLPNDPLGHLMPVNLLYAAGHDLAHPHLSPLFGDVTGFPPTCLLAGTRELFLSNVARMQRNLLDAGVPVELHLIEGMHHFGSGIGSAEEQAILRRLTTFERRVLAAG